MNDREIVPKQQTIESTKPLPFTTVDKILDDDELPNISICIPCYKRQKFVSLILTNIVAMDYPKEKLEVNILQDGEEGLFNPTELEFFKKEIAPATLQYKHEPKVRRSIGEKRNLLVKSSKYKHLAMMDSDDIYLPTYLRYSISGMKQYKSGITTSAGMLFIYPHLDYKLTGIQCGHKWQGHEACCVFTKRHWKSMGGFISKGKLSNMGEGVKMIEAAENLMVNLDISMLMICVAHKGEEGNTIDKDRFISAEIDKEINDMRHLEVLKNIMKEDLNQN